MNSTWWMMIAAINLGLAVEKWFVWWGWPDYNVMGAVVSTVSTLIAAVGFVISEAKSAEPSP